MASGKTFFSYSRDDSEFVLKLAKDLRSAGVDVWLDQLDISAGKRWDAEIEKALESAQVQLVILSPSSVGSNNVMDEVSYSLEKGKNVIPILFKECQVPFRLKRLQYINFTGSYDIGFNELLKALNLDKTIEPEKVESIPEAVDVTKSNEEKAPIDNKASNEKERDQELKTEENLWAKSKSENTIASFKHYLDETKLGNYKNEANRFITKIEKDTELKRSEVERIDKEKIAKAQEKDQLTSQKNKYGQEVSIWAKKSYLKWAVPLFVIVVVIAVVIIMNLPTENDAWEKARITNTIVAYVEFMKAYPDGEHFREASSKKDKLVDDSLFTEAKSINTIKAYNNYLIKALSKDHIKDAEDSIKKIKDNEIALAQNDAWEKADSSNIIWVIQDYVDNNSESKYIINAKEKIELLKKNAGIYKREDFVVCKNVSNLEPQGIDSVFNKGKVYAHARVRTPKNNEQVRFEWLDSNSKSLRRKDINLSGSRIWDPHTFTEKGTYEVRLYNSEDKIIGSQTFTIK